jgi:hypothetical protein
VTGKRHDYQVSVTWTGNLGEGTASHTAYSRNHDVTGGAKPTIPGTADPAFRGDPTRWNPEELLVASLSRSAIAFIELVTVADDRHGGPVGAEATLVPLQAPPEILYRLTENIEQTADRAAGTVSSTATRRGSPGAGSRSPPTSGIHGEGWR